MTKIAAPELFTLPPQSAESQAAAYRSKAYAAMPGAGPAGETCGTCAHSGWRGGVAGRYFKCALMRATWTGGKGSDIKMRSPACSKWEAPDIA